MLHATGQMTSIVVFMDLRTFGYVHWLDHILGVFMNPVLGEQEICALLDLSIGLTNPWCIHDPMLDEQGICCGGAYLEDTPGIFITLIQLMCAPEMSVSC